MANKKILISSNCKLKAHCYCGRATWFW